MLKGFKQNQGLLRSGAVAYYTLLSIVPLTALLSVGLSHMLDQEVLLETVRQNLALVLLFGAQVIAEFERCSSEPEGPDGTFRT